MATTFFTRTVHKGSPTRDSAAWRIRYITRTVGRQAEGSALRQQGTADEADPTREDLVYWRARNLPDWAGADPVVFFRTAEQSTWPSQIAYEEWRCSLPRELSRGQQMDAARDLLTSTFGNRHPYVWALHDTTAADGGRQPHVHVLWSSRTLDGLSRSPEQFFRLYNRAHPERGGAEKAREFGSMGAVKAMRVHYTDVMNVHLERAGAKARLHPERLEARGLLRAPEPRLSPADSRALKRGEITRAMQEVLDHRQRYAVAKSREEGLRQQYWEARKHALGLTREMAPREALERIRAAWTERGDRAPAPVRAEAERSRMRSSPSRDRDARLQVPLVGNRSSKIYHRSGDHNYGDVRPRNQVLFWTVAEAEGAGFRAASNQHYGRGAEVHREEHSHAGVHDRARDDDYERSRLHSRRQRLLLSLAEEPQHAQGSAVRVRVFDEARERQYAR
jgi:MobA/MobL family